MKKESAGKKNLLIYAHYYIPDTASTGQILRELAEGMLDKFNITVICVVPSYLGTIEDKYKTQKYYEEEINGVNVLRIRVPEFSKTNKVSRVRNILSYFFGAMSATFKVGKQDYVFSISQPPILGGLLGVWGKWVKHAKYIYNIQDFNPEQVLAVGYTKSKFVTDAMMWFDKFSCKRSDLIITVGRDLVETVEGRFKGKKVPKTVMINNWIDENEIYPLEAGNERVVAFKKKYGLDSKFVIMYSGNIGLYYDLENLIKVVEKFGADTKTADGREVATLFAIYASLFTNCVLIVNRQEKLCLKATVVSAIVNVGLNFVLMPTLGMIGAAVTTVIAELVNCMMQMCFSKAFFDWRTLEVKPIVSCICGSAFIGITCLLCNGFFHNSLMKMACAVVLSALVYVITLIVMRNPYATAAMDVIKKRMRKSNG